LDRDAEKMDTQSAMVVANTRILQFTADGNASTNASKTTAIGDMLRKIAPFPPVRPLSRHLDIERV